MNGSRQVYLPEPESAPVNTRRFGRLDGSDDRELPDAKLTEAQKRPCRELVEICFRAFSSHALIFLAGAFEDAANRKKAEEEARG